MSLYRFSPIKTIEELHEALVYTHEMCHELSKESFGVYLPVLGNIGVFSHYDDEYDQLLKIQKDLVDMQDDYNGKYFRLHTPIIIPKTESAPAAVYTHLYIRKPDPYRSQVGDLDFYMPSEQYAQLKNSLASGSKQPGVRLFERPETDIIELFNPDNDTLAYLNSDTL